MNKRIFLSPPHMGGEELQFVNDVFSSNYIAPVGPALDAFEKEMSSYLGIPHVVALTSGTAAVHLTLKHLGIGKGDVVLASTLTFIGSVSPVTYEGGELIFIDADPQTWNMDHHLLTEGIEKCNASGKRIKAVIPTDLYGQCSDIEQIRAICDMFDIPVILDSAESLGSLYKDRAAGHGAFASIYSFNGNKIITTSGGGLLASEDKQLIDHARKLATQAKDDFPYYHHSEIGYNYRMSNVVAAIGMGQLKVLDDRVRRRREINRMYRNLLADTSGISFMPEVDYCKSNCWLTVLLFDPEVITVSPEAVRVALENENIEARPVWKPMHMQPVFKNNLVIGGHVAESLFRNGLCLPSGTSMDNSDIERIVEVIRNCVVNSS